MPGDQQVFKSFAPGLPVDTICYIRLDLGIIGFKIRRKINPWSINQLDIPISTNNDLKGEGIICHSFLLVNFSLDRQVSNSSRISFRSIRGQILYLDLCRVGDKRFYYIGIRISEKMENWGAITFR